MSRDHSGDTGLMAPWYAHPDGTMRHDPPATVRLVRPSPPDAPPQELEQTVTIMQQHGALTVYLADDHHPTIRLGGGYVEFFRDLLAFSRRSPQLREEMRLSPGFHLSLMPSIPEESHGLLGCKQPDGACVLYAHGDKASGRALLDAMAAEFPGFRGNIEQAKSAIERSSLPESGGGPPIRLGPGVSWWIVWWYRVRSHVAQETP